MYGQDRGEDRSPRHGPALFLGALILAAGCRSPGDSPPAPSPEPLNSELLREYSKTFLQFVDALQLCGSSNPRDWEGARKQLGALQPFSVFQEDPELIRRFRAGDDSARVELGRRGKILGALSVFWQPYDKARWDDARLTLMGSGEAAQHLLVKTLLNILLYGQLQETAVHVRYHLVETGAMGLETTALLAREMAARTSETPLFKLDDLTQVMMALIGFGDKGRRPIEGFAQHPTANVRRAVAKAVGESGDATDAPILVRLIEDGDWTVRSAAAEAMGRLGAARATVGPALVARIKKERESYVLHVALRAVGDVRYAEGVPDLMKVLEVPSLDTAEAAMYALYRITGERLIRKEQWLEWYARSWPGWKARRSK